MSELELAESIRTMAVNAVKAREKPVSVQVATYTGNNQVSLYGTLTVDAVIPRSVGEVKSGERVLVLKQDGANIYYVVAVL